jgi:tryptophan synthase alpha subunit
MVAEIQTAYANPVIANHAQAFADELVDEGLNAVIAAELEAGIDPDEKWWR